MTETFGEADMASKASADGGIVVYRTVQKSPGLMGRKNGPLFSTMEEAKTVAEEFVEHGLDAEPTEWFDAENGRGVEMIPASTHHTLAVEPVTVHESAEEVTPAEQPGDRA